MWGALGICLQRVTARWRALSSVGSMRFVSPSALPIWPQDIPKLRQLLTASRALSPRFGTRGPLSWTRRISGLVRSSFAPRINTRCFVLGWARSRREFGEASRDRQRVDGVPEAVEGMLGPGSDEAIVDS